MPTPVQPEVDVAARLASGLSPTRIVAPTTGATIFYGKPKSVVSPGVKGTTTSIWVDPSGGAGGGSNTPYLNASASGSRYVMSLRCWVVSGPDDYLGGLLLARQVRDVLHTKHQQIGSAYCLCVGAPGGEPKLESRAEGAQHRFYVDFKLSWVYQN